MSPGQIKNIEEKELVSLIQSKDSVAMEYLYDHYSGALFGAILRIVNNKEVAEEVLQDCLMKIWHKIDLYDFEKGRLFTWMINIARNLAKDKVRSKEIRQGQKTDDLQNHQPDYEKAYQTEQKTEGIGVKEILMKLNEKQRLVLELVYFKGYSHAEVSREYDIPLGSVKTRLRNALIELRTILSVS